MVDVFLLFVEEMAEVEVGVVGEVVRDGSAGALLVEHEERVETLHDFIVFIEIVQS